MGSVRESMIRNLAQQFGYPIPHFYTTPLLHRVRRKFMSTLNIIDPAPAPGSVFPWLKRPMPKPGMAFTSNVTEDLNLVTV